MSLVESPNPLVTRKRTSTESCFSPKRSPYSDLTEISPVCLPERPPMKKRKRDEKKEWNFLGHSVSKKAKYVDKMKFFIPLKIGAPCGGYNQ